MRCPDFRGLSVYAITINNLYNISVVKFNACTLGVGPVIGMQSHAKNTLIVQ